MTHRGRGRSVRVLLAARPRCSGRQVAIKALRGDADLDRRGEGRASSTRIRERPRALASALAPRLRRAPRHGRGRERGGAPYLVFEFVEGRPCGSAWPRARCHRPRSRPSRARSGRAHATRTPSDFVHGDVKPENVMLSPVGAQAHRPWIRAARARADDAPSSYDDSARARARALRGADGQARARRRRAAAAVGGRRRTSAASRTSTPSSTGRSRRTRASASRRATCSATSWRPSSRASNRVDLRPASRVVDRTPRDATLAERRRRGAVLVICTLILLGRQRRAPGEGASLRSVSSAFFVAIGPPRGAPSVHHPRPTPAASLAPSSPSASTTVTVEAPEADARLDGDGGSGRGGAIDPALTNPLLRGEHVTDDALVLVAQLGRELTDGIGRVEVIGARGVPPAVEGHGARAAARSRRSRECPRARTRGRGHARPPDRSCRSAPPGRCCTSERAARCRAALAKRPEPDALVGVATRQRAFAAGLGRCRSGPRRRRSTIERRRRHRWRLSQRRLRERAPGPAIRRPLAMSAGRASGSLASMATRRVFEILRGLRDELAQSAAGLRAGSCRGARARAGQRTRAAPPGTRRGRSRAQRCRRGRRPACSSFTCSGARYPGVPSTMPEAVGAEVVCTNRAAPKSSTFTRAGSPATRKRLLGFTSRCTTPRRVGDRQRPGDGPGEPAALARSAEAPGASFCARSVAVEPLHGEVRLASVGVSVVDVPDDVRMPVTSASARASRKKSLRAPVRQHLQRDPLVGLRIPSADRPGPWPRRPRIARPRIAARRCRPTASLVEYRRDCRACPTGPPWRCGPESPRLGVSADDGRKPHTFADATAERTTQAPAPGRPAGEVSAERRAPCQALPRRCCSSAASRKRARAATPRARSAASSTSTSGRRRSAWAPSPRSGPTTTSSRPTATTASPSPRA